MAGAITAPTTTMGTATATVRAGTTITAITVPIIGVIITTIITTATDGPLYSVIAPVHGASRRGRAQDGRN